MIPEILDDFDFTPDSPTNPLMKYADGRIYKFRMVDFIAETGQIVSDREGFHKTQVRAIITTLKNRKDIKNLESKIVGTDVVIRMEVND